MDHEGVSVGTITIDLFIDGDGAMIVSTGIDGDLQYLIAMGMLEMAKGSLDEVLGDDD